jgi:hypothetical protein
MRLNKMKEIQGIHIYKYFNNLLGQEVTNIIVGGIGSEVGTKIAKYKDNEKYQLNVNTTPKTGFLDLNKDFDSIEEAKEYYLTNLVYYFEIMNKIMKEYENEVKETKRMKVWILKKDLDFLKESQDEGRTRQVEISTFRQYDNNSEIEIEVKE